MSDWELEDAVRDEIFQRSIRPLYFPESSRSDSRPSLVILAGQPGAGRSRLAGTLRAAHGPGLASVNGDDLRAFHPRFLEIARARDADAHMALARVTAGWVRGCIRYARENGRSLALEGAFQDPALPIGMTERFAAEGFRTQVAVVASRRAESLLTIASQYLGEIRVAKLSRFVSRETHDRGLEGTRALAAASEDAASVDRLTIVSRSGETVFDGRRNDGDESFRGASEALEAARSARLSRFDATQWLSELHHVSEFAASRRDLPRGVDELLVDLHEVALNEVVPELHVPRDSAFATTITRRTTTNLAALRRSIAREQQTRDVAAPVIAPAGPDLGGISR